MTNPATTPTRLALPTEGAIYKDLSTDFYPWTELLTDLERRQSAQWSAVLDVQDGERWARFVWAGGQARGGLAPNGSEVSLATIMQGLPRAKVTLVETQAAVADLVWNCRAVAAQPVSAGWPAAGPLLERERFTGALLGTGGQTTFWERGKLMAGQLPTEAGDCRIVIAPAARAAQVLEVWQQVFALTQRKYPQFGEIWRQVSLQLAGEYTILDPFDHEVYFDGQTLEITEDAPPEEVLPALQAAYAASLRRLGVKVADLPVQELREQGTWQLLGLEDV